MLKKIKFFLFSSLLIPVLSLPILASADSVQDGLRNSRFLGIFPTGGLAASQSLTELIATAVRMMLFFAGGIAVLFMVVGGYWYLTSGGNEEQTEKGKSAILNAIIGIVIIILSYAITNVVVNLVSTGRIF